MFSSLISLSVFKRPCWPVAEYQFKSYFSFRNIFWHDIGHTVGKMNDNCSVKMHEYQVCNIPKCGHWKELGDFYLKFKTQLILASLLVWIVRSTTSYYCYWLGLFNKNQFRRCQYPGNKIILCNRISRNMYSLAKQWLISNAEKEM